MNKEYVLITGATSGIGYELMLLFAKNKYNLPLVSRNKEKLKNIKTKIEKKYKIHIEYLDIDLSESDSAEKVYYFITNNKLNISILINNSGFGLKGKFEENDLQKYEEMVNLNILTLTKLTYLVLQDMKKRKKGKILNLASVAAFLPGPYMSVYFATKAYVLSFSEALFFENSADNITITALCPGSTKTNFASVAGFKSKDSFNKNAMSASQVALIGYKGLMKGKRVVIAGGLNNFSVFFIKFIPNRLIGKMILRFNNSSSAN